MNNLNNVITCLIKSQGLHHLMQFPTEFMSFLAKFKLHGFLCTSGILSIVVLMKFRVKEREIESLERSYQHINNWWFPFLLKTWAFYLSAPCRADYAVSVWRKHNLFLLPCVSFSSCHEYPSGGWRRLNKTATRVIGEHQKHLNVHWTEPAITIHFCV